MKYDEPFDAIADVDLLRAEIRRLRGERNQLAIQGADLWDQLHPKEPRLTVAEVLKQTWRTFLTHDNCVMKFTAEPQTWQIWRNGEMIFESPDEHLACAEFLRQARGDG